MQPDRHSGGAIMLLPTDAAPVFKVRFARLRTEIEVMPHQLWAGGLNNHRRMMLHALAENAPTLIEVMTDITKEASPWEVIYPGRG